MAGGDLQPGKLIFIQYELLAIRVDQQVQRQVDVGNGVLIDLCRQL